MTISVSIIVPTLNEAENLPHVLPRIPAMPEITEVILVDGHSTDGTAEVARTLIPSIMTVMQRGKGKGNAIRSGVRAASGTHVLVLDADGSHTPEEIPLYIEKARQGYDFIKGSRYLEGGKSEDETLERGLMVRLTDLVANILWSTKFEDMAYGMFMIDRQKFNNLGVTANYFEIEWDILIKAKRHGLRIARVPAYEAARIHGESHLTYRRDGWLIFKLVMREGLLNVKDRALKIVSGRRKTAARG